MFYKDGDVVLRVCKTPDRKRIVGAWALYYDASKKFPDKGWLPPDTPTPPPFQIRSINGKGRGMVATRDIKVGEIIINERPILMTPYAMQRRYPGNPWMDVEVPLLQILYALEQEDRSKLLRLHNCKSLDNFGPLGGILNTNAISFRVPGSQVCEQYGAICLTISYANHACSPNAMYEYDTDTVIFDLRARRNIAKGEEITLGYINDKGLMTAERQALLKGYGFKCACKLCANGPASDERRRFIAKTLRSMESVPDEWGKLELDRRAKTSFAKRTSAIVETLLRAIDEEGLDGDSLRPIVLCFDMYSELGDVKQFKKWIKKALEAEAKMGNNASPECVEKLEGWLKDPTTKDSWDGLAIELSRVPTVTIYL